MRYLALLLAITTSLHAQTPPPGDRHTDNLRFTLILAAPGAAAIDHAKLPPLTATAACAQPAEIYLYAMRDTQAAAREARTALAPTCPALPIYTAITQPDPLLTGRADNLLAHLLDTLQQAAGTPVSPAAIVTPVAAAKLATSVRPKPPPAVAAVAASDSAKSEAQQPASTSPAKPTAETRINGAIGPAGTRIVYVAAPAATLSALTTLLGLPPGNQLTMELLQKHHKKSDLFPPWLIRLSSGAAPLTPTGCRRTLCDLPVFLHAARARVDPAQTTLDVPPTQLMP